MFTKEFTIELHRRSHNRELEECLRMLESAHEHIDPRTDPSESEIRRSILSARAFVYYENERWHEAAEEYSKLCEVASVYDPFVTCYHSMWAQMTFRDHRAAEAQTIFRGIISMWISMAKGPAEGLDLFFDYRKFKGELNEPVEEEYRNHIEHIAHYYGEEVNSDEGLFEILDRLRQIKHRESRAYGDLVIRYRDNVDDEEMAKLEHDIQEYLLNAKTPYLREQAIGLLKKLRG